MRVRRGDVNPHDAEFFAGRLSRTSCAERIMIFFQANSSPVQALAFSPDGTLLATGNLAGEVCIWDTATGAVRTLRGFPTTSSGGISTVGFHPDGSWVVGVGSDRLMRWDLANPQARPDCLSPEDARTVALDKIDLQMAWIGYRGIRSRPVSHLKMNDVRRQRKGWELIRLFSPDGTRSVIGENNGHVCIWDNLTGELLHDLFSKPTTVCYLAFSADGGSIAWTDIRWLSVWDLDPPRERVSLEIFGWNLTVAFHPSGRFLLVGDHDGTIRLREVESGQEWAAYSWGIGSVWKVAFSPDGLRAAACGQSGKIVVWDVDV